MVYGHKGCGIAAIYGELGWTEISDDITIRALNFFGHLGGGVLGPERWSQTAFLEGLEAVRKGIITPWWKKIQNIIRVYGIDPSRFQNVANWRQYVQDTVKESQRETHPRDG